MTNLSSSALLSALSALALIGCRAETHILQDNRHDAGADLLAGGNDRVVFAGIVKGRGVAGQADEPVGLARHGGNDRRATASGRPGPC